MKQFIAITSETYQKRLVLLNTSGGMRLFNPEGIELDEALDFLFKLRHLKKRQPIVFVVYGFSRDNEFLFSLLERRLRDKLFQTVRIKEELGRLEFEQENLDDAFYKAKDEADREAYDFERYVNSLAIQELLEVRYKDYKIKLANGKRLRITKGKQSITIYDIYGFFKPSSLRKAYRSFCDKDLPLLDRGQFSEFLLSRDNELDAIKRYSDIEVSVIAELAISLNNRLLEVGINLTRYHGATAISSWFLGRTKARKEFHNYRYKRQLSAPLHDALHKSFFAGRAEQIKIGTKTNVHVYDINSAYGFAAAMLPVMLRKPIYQKQYEDSPFSFWFCEFDFTKAGLNLGVLPFRDRNTVYFPLIGKGYYWQPEIRFVLKKYPECIKIAHGYSLPYERANFAKEIINLYEMRLQMKREGNAAEKAIKLAIASLYGKFCQHNGRGNFYNLFYAGFITSIVRRMLLDAIQGHEDKIICFLTDCIHSTGPLPLPVSDQLGDWKHETYAKVRYLDNGIYECYNEKDRPIKTKIKGFRHLRFDAAAFELQKRQSFSARSEFFVGHNVYTQHLFESARYLETIVVDKINRPLAGKARKFAYQSEDLLTELIDSLPVIGSLARESGPYQISGFKDADLALDTIEARRI